MKRIPIILLFCFFLFITGQAQVSKTINVTTPATLSTLLTSTELSTVTNLTVTGDIDARDFEIIKIMISLSYIDLSNCNIKEYNAGLQPWGSILIYSANTIPSYALFQRTKVNKIILPNTCTDINENAFAYAYGLKNIVFPKSIRKIGGGGFYFCSGLDSISIPNTIKIIGSWAFNQCSNLKKIKFNGSVDSIGPGAFSSCNILQNLDLPLGIKSIENELFRGCPKLTSVTMPNTVSKIGKYAFESCTCLNNIVLSDSISSLGEAAFSSCTNLTNISLPVSLQRIERSVFSSCSNLTEIVLPFSVSNIGEYVFYNCTSLSTIKSCSPIPVDLSQSQSVFTGVNTKTCQLYVPFMSKDRYSKANQWNDFANIVVDLQSKGVYIKKDSINITASGKTTINIPIQSNTSWKTYINRPWLSVNKSQFSGNDSLVVSAQENQSLFPREAIITINVIGGAPQLIKVTQDGTTVKVTLNKSGSLSKYISSHNRDSIWSLNVKGNIDARDFKFMRDSLPNLAILNLTGSTINKFESAYLGTYYVSYNYVYEANTLPVRAFSGKQSLKTISLPTSCTAIDQIAFEFCFNLKSIIIPAAIKSIGYKAFQDCLALESVYSIAETPINLLSYTYIYIDLSKCNLYVPTNSKNTYSIANEWKNFGNIIENIPLIVFTDDVTNISASSAIGNNYIASLDVNNSTVYGLTWSNLPNPCVENNPKTTNKATDVGLFPSLITGLKPLTKYYVRAYATNSYGTTYGEEVSFVTKDRINLTITNPSVVTNKVVDGSTSAKISALGVLEGVDVADSSNVSVTATASYDNAIVGTNKTITVVYMLTGGAKDNYIPPANYVIRNAEISDGYTSITNPTIVTNKMIDGNTNAVVTQLGILQGVVANDANNVSVTATATYDNANVGTNKTITVVYTLSGSASNKYIAPANYLITNAKISDYITLSPLSIPSPGCEGSTMDLPFTLLTGTPTQYKITFNAAALSAGMKNVANMDLSNANAGGVLTFSVPKNTKDGTYQGIVKMKNELYIESIDYPFTFTINVSADYIHTKFNDIILFDNSEKRFDGYQWYINGIEIPGATKQFYTSPIGLIGNYSLKLTTTDGKTLYTCPKVLNLFSVKAQVSTFPNPVKENETYTVQIIGLNEDQLRNSEISVFNMQGICIYKSRITGNVNNMNLPVNGAYIGHVTATGIDNVFKIIVVK